MNIKMTSAPLAYADNEEKHNTMRRKNTIRKKHDATRGRKVIRILERVCCSQIWSAVGVPVLLLVRLVVFNVKLMI